MRVETLIIDRRFRGPSRSGNGGYVCGRLARHIAGAARVRLRLPPPLETELHIEADDGVVRLLHQETVIAEGRAAVLDLSPPPPPSPAEARAASRNFAGFKRHSFPHCFVCGTRRGAGDGLRLFAGRLPDRDLVAAAWTADVTLARGGRVGDEFLWAALDCPSAFAAPAPSPGKALVLGQLTARIEGPVHPGETCVVIAWPIGAEGRKRDAGSAVFDPSGRRVAVARATWIEVPESAFPPDEAD